MDSQGGWRARMREVFGIDLRTLALFRVALGGTLLVDLVNRFFDARAFYTDWGLLPRDWLIQIEWLPRVSLYFASGDLWFVCTLLAITLAAGVAFFLGWRTRVATVLLFVLIGSLQTRNPIVLIGGDSLIMCLLFWSLFLPLGARWSVDAALSTRAPPRENLHCSFASAGLLIQVMSVYFFSAWLKDGADWWPDGLAVYYVSELERYATPALRWGAQFPLVMKGLSYWVYFLEWVGPILAFSPLLTRPLRFLVMLQLVAMHVGFMVCMEIGHFPYVSVSSLMTFLGGWFWDWRGRGRDRGGNVTIYYDRDCGFCVKMCLLFREFLAIGEARVLPAQDYPEPRRLLEENYSWVVMENGTPHLKWAAFVALVRHSPARWLATVLGAPLFTPPGNGMYDLVGRWRKQLGTITALLLPRREEKFEVGRLGQAIAGAFLVAVFAWNLTTVKVLPESVILALRPVFCVLRIDQLWNMFAPYPSRADGWIVYPGKLEDGTEVDVLRPGRPLDWAKPEYISQTHENVRWHTLQWRMWEKEFSAHRLHYGKYLCREWNWNAAPGKHLLSYDMVHVQEFSLPPGQTPKPERVTLWQHRCVAPALGS